MAAPPQPSQPGPVLLVPAAETWVDQFRDACGGCIGLLPLEQPAVATCGRRLIPSPAACQCWEGSPLSVTPSPRLREAITSRPQTAAMQGRTIRRARGSAGAPASPAPPTSLAPPARPAAPCPEAGRLPRRWRCPSRRHSSRRRYRGRASRHFRTVAAHAKRRNREPFATSIGCNGSIAAAIGAGSTAAALCQWQAALSRQPPATDARRPPRVASGNAARLWRRRRRHGLLESARLADRAPPGLWGRV